VLKIVFLIYASWGKAQNKKALRWKPGAFSNQKPLTIKPYSMKIRGEYRR
jgi:hypothetical protein